MSEIGVISDQYDSLVNITDKINNGIIALKKKFLLVKDPGKAATIKLADVEWSSAKKDLTKLLEFILKIDEGYDKKDALIPKSSFDEFKKSIQRHTDYKKQLKSILNCIKVAKEVNMNQLDFMDDVLAALDNERSVLFKKLRTARV